MYICSLFVLDLFGKPLIHRNYRGTHGHEVIDVFITMLGREDDKSLTPVVQINDLTLAYIMFNNLYLVAITNGNANIALVFVFLYKIVDLMHDYLHELVEESIRDNFVLIYELLDEILDYGLPQITDSKILMEYITQESKQLDKKITIPPAVTNAVSWRSEGIKYKKNEVFLDILECINFKANANGVVVRSEIIGSIRLKSRLSGMPMLRLGLNDKLLSDKFGSERDRYIDLEEVKFHQCVSLCKFENDRNITFIPPDGDFELMSYRLNSFVKPPIWVDCLVEYYRYNRVEYTVNVASRFKDRRATCHADILIPVPCDVDSPVIKVAAGTVKYLPDRNILQWSLKSFAAGKNSFMTARFGLPSVACEDQEPMPPIQVRFEIPFLNISGIRVHYLRIAEKSGYVALPWFRQCTQNGDYEFRQKEVFHGFQKFQGQQKNSN